MNKPILAFIFSLFSLVLFSQKVSVKWGDSFKSTVGILGYTFGGINGKYYYTIESFKGQSEITVCDLNHNIIKKQTIEYKNKDFRVQVVDYIKTSSNFYFIVRGIDLKNDKALVGYVIAESNGNINPNIKDILIYDWDVKALDDGYSYLSSDKSKINISYSPHKKGQQSYKTLFIRLNDKMEKIPNDISIKNDNLNVSNIKINGVSVEDVSIKTLSNKKKIAVGTYTNTDNAARSEVFVKGGASAVTGINGIFYATLDSNGVASSKLYPFTVAVAEKMGVSSNKLNKGIPELSFSTFVSEKDNDISIFLEEESYENKMKTVNSPSSSYSRTETSILYRTNSIIASNFNENGELQFTTVIEKEFILQDMSDFSSFLAFKKDDNFYFLFNKSKFSVDNKSEVTAKGKILTDLIKLDSKGNIISQETLFGNKDIDLMLSPKNCYPIDGNKILLFGIKGLKYTYGTLEVK